MRGVCVTVRQGGVRVTIKQAGGCTCYYKAGRGVRVTI
ncbi:hypothetical protein Hamer_G026768 [Homarus americanus]|uniref:Uncharacterized protein n=1 Tax=Homarus americanus TaxID=6706 RepID=A0A8J5JRQ2_HOMAM|nr:hypothetical protein Hamer_G026768 [Homarus americanus]